MSEKFNLEELRKKQQEIKKEVERFKEERKGLLPELFSLPGEEIEKEKEYPEEYLLAYKLRKLLTETPIKEIYPDIEANEEFKNSTIEKEMKNETLWKNALQEQINYINTGQELGNTWSAWDAFLGYTSLKLSGFWSEIKRKFSLECQQVEKGMKNKTLWKNMLQDQINDINTGQKLGNTGSAWRAFRGYTSLKLSGLWPEVREKFFLECEKSEYQEIEQKYQQIEDGMKNKTLWKNALQEQINDINKGQKLGNTWSAWHAFLGYISLRLSGFWSEIKEKFSLECQQIENGMKNETLWKNMLQAQINDINKGQKLGNTESAWRALRDYTFLSFFLTDLEKIADQKMKELEHQKALHPEEKNIPPRPEARSF